MQVHQRSLGFQGRDIIFRPIEFERYRKPHVVEYPRHALVLNPHHTQQQRQNSSAQKEEEEEDDDDDDGEEEDHARTERPTEDDHDDDPAYTDASLYLCSDEALRKVMHLRWRHVGAAGAGLHNLGNTCFANAVLQAVAYTPAMAQYFMDTFKAADQGMGAPYDFAYALGETLRQLHRHSAGSGTSSSAAVRPSLILGHLRQLSNHFSIGKQSDAHEFAVQLLHACQRSILFRQVGSRKVAPRVGQTTTLHRICGGYLRSQVAWSRKEEVQQLLRAGKKQDAIDLKMEQQSSSSSGAADVMVSNTYDPFTILNVELVGQSLEHCLANFCAKETLDGRCYHTPREVGVHATKQFRIHVPPPVLIIQLKRFGVTGKKVGKRITYPKILDIHDFLTQRRDGGARSISSRYELNAICIHDGHSINFGHYYSMVRGRNGAWLECNDAYVRSINEDTALNQAAYMLFYSRIEEPKRSASTTKDAKPHGPSSRSSLGGARLSAMLPSQTTMEVEQVGREEELATILASKKHKRVLSEEEEKDDAPRAVASANGDSSKVAMKRKREELSSDDDGEGGEVGPPSSWRLGRPSAEEKSAEPSHTESRASAPQQKPINKLGRYGGIIRSITRHDGGTPQHGQPRTGRSAVTTLEHEKMLLVPESVQRPTTAPKFQQKIRDPMWQMEMDKGRVKKVRAKQEAREHDGINRFQQVAGKTKFDIRGRREGPPERRQDE